MATQTRVRGVQVGPRRVYRKLSDYKPPTPEAIERYSKVAVDVGIQKAHFERLVKVHIGLHRKQLYASSIAVLCDFKQGPREVGFGGAMTGGKSHWMLAQIVDDCMRHPGLKCLLLRKIGRSNKEGFEDLRARVLAAIPHDWRRSEGVLYFPNGSRILLGHFQHEGDVDQYLGLEYDVIGVEEATTLSEPKYKAILTRNRTSKEGWRPRTYSTTNPGGVGHAWYKKRFILPWRENRETTTRFIPATVDDNPSVNEENKEILDELDGWELRAWRFGDWDIESGGFFETFAPIRIFKDQQYYWHVQPPFRVPVEHRGWSFIAGIDYGTTNSSFSFHLGAISPRGILYIIDELYIGKETPQEKRTDAAYAKAVKDCILKHKIPLNKVNIAMDWAETFPPKTVTDRRGVYPVEEFWKLKLRCFPAEKARVVGWRQVLNYLNTQTKFVVTVEDEKIYGYRKSGNLCMTPMVALFKGRCPNLERTIPLMMHAERNPEDLDDKLECHAVDSFRYLMQQRPSAKEAQAGKTKVFDESLLPTALRN